MKRHLFFFSVFLFATLSSAQDTDSIPEKVVKDFLGHNGITDKRAVYCGEMLQRYIKTPTLGQSLPATSEKSYRLLSINDTRAVYAVAITTDSVMSDWYFYLNKSNAKWKLEAVRSLAFPGFFFDILHDLERKTNRTGAEQATYANMKLTASCDSVLKSHLLANIDDFKHLALLTASSDNDTTIQLIKNLHLTSIQPFRSNTKIIEFLIGGILDSSVGFFYIPDGCTPPEMDASTYIYIECIITNWYIYKTT